MVYSTDRILHWSILGLTAPLPRPLRVRSRHRLLRALQNSAMRKADAMIIRHPKTGGTWLRVLLTRLYSLKYGTSVRRVFKADELYRQNRNLPRFLVTNGYISWERTTADAFSADAPFLAGKKTIFLARHPGDVAVSWYIQYTKRTKAFKREMMEYEMMDGHFDREGISRWEFLQHPVLGLDALIDYHNFWAEVLHQRDDALIVRYEDLRTDTAKTLRRMTDFLGEDFTDEHIMDAVDFGSVDNLRAKEREGYFHNTSLRLRNADDPDTLKVRRAKVGGFHEDLDPEQAEWVEKRVSERCHPALGYGKK